MNIKTDTTKINGSGNLEIGGADVVALAKKHGTPLYLMDEVTLRGNCRSYSDVLKKSYPNHLVAYAGKANLNVGILNILADEGFGVDVVSGGELFTALKSNMDPQNIVFHGNNKSEEEIVLALKHRIRLVLDNEQELEMVSDLAQKAGVKARVMFRIKPEIEAHTHEYIKTGQIDSKFGMDKKDMINVVKRLSSNPNFEFLGIHSHIGSQIFDIEPFEDLADLMVDHLAKLKTELGMEIQELNLGGGIGIRYTEEDDPPEIAAYLERLVSRLVEGCESKGVTLPKLILEPGRSIVGNAGVTLYKVGAVKEIPGIKDYIFVDGGMADNPRPIMYQAKYSFVLGNKPDAAANKPYSIAGKFCESGDVLAEGVFLPDVQVGDVLVVYCTGAYNYSMASNYNRFQRPAMVMVKDGSSSEIIRRETYDDVIQYDVMT